MRRVLRLGGRQGDRTGWEREGGVGEKGREDKELILGVKKKEGGRGKERFTRKDRKMGL